MGINLSPEVVDYFKGLAEETGLPYQKLIDLYLLDCARKNSARTNIDINEALVRQARKLTRLKTKRQIVHKALELLVRSESRKGILRYYGSGAWQGDPKAIRRNRA